MYRSLVDLVPAITYAEALDTRRTFSISPQVESILGFTPEGWMGDASRWEGALHPDDVERMTQIARSALETGGPWNHTFRMIRGEGRIVWLLERGRREAIVRMKEEARRNGATSVVHVRLETASLSEDFSGRRPWFSAEFIAYGTALVPKA